ncbi:MAG TPA: PilZ domain-containing protein [Pseudobdellovibrionaceae bacterium]|nr:PilZ domain-containing protein [Pseudobdellovibrionaceae bacterium]
MSDQIPSSSRETRFDTKELAIIEVYGKMGKAPAQLKNISKTGAFLELNHTKILPQKGDILQITVQLKELRKERTLSAEVVWNQGFSLGIQFLAKDQVVSKLMNKWKP